MQSFNPFFQFLVLSAFVILCLNISRTECNVNFEFCVQAEQGVRLSLWLQWTLPRLVIKLFGDVPNDKLPICITADLEDLTAFVDYQDTHLQMQYKVGGFGVTHAVKR